MTSIPRVIALAAVAFPLSLAVAASVPFRPAPPAPLQETQSSDSAGRSAIEWRPSAREAKLAGATYGFRGSGLIDTLDVDGHALLRSAARLHVEDSNGPLDLHANDLRVSESSVQGLSLRSRTASDEITAGLSLQLEPDGFLLVTLDIAPVASRAELTRLYLDLPLTARTGNVLSRHLPYDFESQRFSRESLLDGVEVVAGVLERPFSPVVSLESREYGIEWMAETDAHHSLTDDGVAIVARAVSGGGTDLRFNLVDLPIQIRERVSYQFSLFPIPSRPPSRGAQTTVIASAADTRRFVQRFGGLEPLEPVYFAHWKRLPFEHVGLPVLADDASSRARREREFAALDAAGLGYMPYTSMHLMDGTVDELVDHQDRWPAAPVRRNSWRTLDGRISGAQPVAHDDRSLADFMIAEHLRALAQRPVDVLYHDVAGMNRLAWTRERAVRADAIPSGAFYAPFFGLREYLRRYRDAIKATSPKTEIYLHTGSLLPKSIATHADAVVFGESLHFAFSNGAEYRPDYFGLPAELFEGPLSQKNGFDYVLLPQLVRKVNGIEPDKALLRAQTRSLIAFAFMHDYPVWSTKLDALEYRKHLERLASVGGLGRKRRNAGILPAENDAGEAAHLRAYVRPGANGADVALIYNPTASSATVEFDDEPYWENTMQQWLAERMPVARVSVPAGDFSLFVLPE